MPKALLGDNELVRSDIVANAVMNRQRNLLGGNSYQKELGFDPIAFMEKRLASQRQVSWLDLCCGTGKALIQAAQYWQDRSLSAGVSILGLDLIPLFDPIPPVCSSLRLQAVAIHEWIPQQQFDLVTCVHGLHYVGDKLGAIQKAAASLKEDGLFLAHLDYDNLHLDDRKSARVRIGKDLRAAGFKYNSKRHVLTCQARPWRTLNYQYLGADDHAGPNYTRQPAVDSYYRAK